jgi:Cdc6-like AAA superfamily ATPase
MDALDQVFVSRQSELEKLHSLLARASEGSGQICFVTGEAGFGKTSLTAEFARRAQLRDEAIREAADAAGLPADVVVEVGELHAAGTTSDIQKERFAAN